MRKAIILFGHGSRDPQWRAPMEAVARRVRQAQPGVDVHCAYLELDTPDLATAARSAIDTGAGEVSVVPMFLGMGRHAREDLPALVDALRAEFAAVRFELRPAVGEDSRVLDLLAKIAGE
jgi:sirohydrochlorin cobaltochelatase